MKMRKSNNSTSFEFDLDSDEDLGAEAKKAFAGELEDENLEDGYVEENQEEDEQDDPSNEEESEEDDQNEEEDTEEQEEGDESEEGQEDDDNQEDVKNKKNPSKKSPAQKQFGERANKRIRDLNARAKTAEDYASKVAQEADAAKKERYESEKARVEMQKELLELKKERYTQAYVNASQDGDYEKQAEANAELAKIGTQLAAIEGVSSKYKGEYKPEPRQQLQVQPDFDLKKANELATEFEFENPRMIADEAYKATATKIAEGLMNRGFKPDTEEFYTELSSRINKAFSSSPVQEKAGGKTTTQAKVVVKKPAPQAVAGASRTPAPQSGNNTNSKNSVRLSQEQIGEAQRLGQDLKTYARNQQKINDSIKNKGRVSVYLEDL